MLSEEQIKKNKERFLSLIESLKKDPSQDPKEVDDLIEWLNKSDFFEAPASTKYHCAYRGGLCFHSLNVYDCLQDLIKLYATTYETKNITDENGTILEVSKVAKCDYSENTIKIVSLLHDISKTNFYESYTRNVKNEVTDEWEKVREYRVKNEKDRFIYGSHEMNSEYMIHSFFPLKLEESTAVLHHHAGMSYDCAQDDITAVYNRYPLASLLHMADMIACYIKERI